MGNITEALKKVHYVSSEAKDGMEELTGGARELSKKLSFIVAQKSLNILWILRN